MKKVLLTVIIGLTLFCGILNAQDDDKKKSEFASAKDTLKDQLDYYDPSELELEIKNEKSNTSMYFLIGGLVVVGGGAAVVMAKKKKK